MHTRRHTLRSAEQGPQFSRSYFSSTTLLVVRNSGFHRSTSVAENAALVIGVAELCTIRTNAVARSKKNLAGDQHTQGWCKEIKPKCVPVTGVKSGAKGPRGIHAHPGQGSLKCYVDR